MTTINKEVLRARLDKYGDFCCDIIWEAAHAYLKQLDAPKGDRQAALDEMPDPFGGDDAEALEAFRARGLKWLGGHYFTIRKALSAPDHAEEWKPIASAPLTDEQILIYTDRVGFSVVRHDPSDPMTYEGCSTPHHFFVDDGKHGPFPLRGDYPEHWKPLRNPPKKDGA